MAKIAEVEKILEDKVKALKNAIAAIDKQEKLLAGSNKQASAMEDSAKKDKKSKDAAAAAKKARGVADAAGEKLAALNKSKELAEQSISDLHARIRLLTAFVKSRDDFIAWWDKDEMKMMDLADKARDKATDAEEASKAAEKATEKGDTVGATKSAAEAKKAAVDAEDFADKARKLYDTWGPIWDTQRNYKTSDLEKDDVKSYEATTKKAYEAFKSGDKLRAAVIRLASEADQHASNAEDFATSGGDLAATYSKFLLKAKAQIETLAKSMRSGAESKWGGYISKEGAFFDDLSQRLTSGKITKAIIIKAVEQGEPLLAGALNTADRMVTLISRAHEKALARIPANQQQALKPLLQQLQNLTYVEYQYFEEFKQKYETAMVKFNKMKSLVS